MGQPPWVFCTAWKKKGQSGGGGGYHPLCISKSPRLPLPIPGEHIWINRIVMVNVYATRFGHRKPPHSYERAVALTHT